MSKPPLGLLMRIKAHLNKNDRSGLKDRLMQATPFDVAWCLGRIPVEDRIESLSSVKPDVGSKIFQEMPLEQQTEILKVGRLPSLVSLVTQMESDEMADVLGTLDPIEKNQWLSTLPAQELQEAESLLKYDPDTAGGLMAKEYVTVPANLTAGQVVSRLQTLASDFENLKVTYVYVLDKEGVLKGVLPIRDLLFRPRSTPIKTFMIKEITTLPDTAKKTEVAELFRERNLLALPVVDFKKRLVGVITADDILDVIQELAEEEMLKLSGVSSEEPRNAPLSRIVPRRLSWLSINIVLNLTAASVIAFYESTLSAVIALAFFLPIISDMSGCSGMQAVTVSVRDLALNRILPRDYWQVLRKEFLIGLLNGLVLGLIIGLVAYLLKGIPMLGVVVSLALWINSIIAVSFGGVVPLFLKYYKFDPAIASGPILTTITDIMGFFILLSLATYWLPLLKEMPQ